MPDHPTEPGYYWVRALCADGKTPSDSMEPAELCIAGYEGEVPVIRCTGTEIDLYPHDVHTWGRRIRPDDLAITHDEHARLLTRAGLMVRYQQERDTLLRLLTEAIDRVRELTDPSAKGLALKLMINAANDWRARAILARNEIDRGESDV